MKCLIVFACLLVVAYGEIPSAIIEQFKDRMYTEAEACKRELDLQYVDFAPLIKLQKPTTDKGKCYFSCIMKKVDFLDASGKINKKVWYNTIEKVKLLDKDVYQKLVRAANICLSEVTNDDTACEIGVKIFDCVIREKAGVYAPKFFHIQF